MSVTVKSGYGFVVAKASLMIGIQGEQGSRGGHGGHAGETRVHG